MILYKKVFFAKLAMSQRWSAFSSATGVRGGKPIGRVRVKQIYGPKLKTQAVFLVRYTKLENFYPIFDLLHSAESKICKVLKFREI